MTDANGWHHSERVYIQGRFMDRVLVQYVDRHPTHWTGTNKPLAGPVQPWAWLPSEDVMPFSDLDDALMKVWKLA